MQDVLARAVAKGLLEGFGAPLPTHKEKRRHRIKAPPVCPPSVLLEPLEVPEPTSPPSLCPVSDTATGDAPDKVAVSSSELLQATKPRRKHRRSKAPRPQRSHKKHTSKHASRQTQLAQGPAQHRSPRGQGVLSSKQGVLKPRQEVLLSGKELAASKQEVMKPDQEVPMRPKEQVTSRHELLDPKQDVLSSKDRLTSTHNVLKFRQTVSPGNKPVTSKHHVKKSRGGVVSPGLRMAMTSQEEQRGSQHTLIDSRHDVTRPTHELGKAQRKEGRSRPDVRAPEAVRPVELVLPPLLLSHTRLSPSLSRLMSSSSQFSTTSHSSRASSAHWNT